MSITGPILTPKDMPWSLPAAGLYLGLRYAVPILNVPYYEESFIPVSRAMARLVYAAALLCLTTPAFVYHISVAAFYKLRSFNSVYNNTLANEYFKTAFLDIESALSVLGEGRFLDNRPQ